MTGVAITPCSSKQEADESIRQTAVLVQTQALTDPGEESDSSEEETQDSHMPFDEVEDAVAEDVAIRSSSSRSSVAEDVMRRRGSYGRFAQRWFSKNGWTMNQRRSLGLSISTANSPMALEGDQIPSIANVLVDEGQGMQQQPSALLPKLLRTMQVFFGSSRSFYFSYDLDITRSTSQQAWLPKSDIPLHAQVDNHFFWNRHILQKFASTGQDSVSLPLMQGFVGQRPFTVDSDPPQVDGDAVESLELAKLSALDPLPASPPVDRPRGSMDLRASERKYLITLVSRRMTKRAGLRYLRRGVDEDGFTANMVESEQILSSPAWDSSTPIYSFVQIRGSIPLFFTQTAYSLKPVPVIQHGDETNFAACKRHFERLRSAYGSLQIVNLVEKKGVEELIGTKYQKSIERLNEELGADDRIAFQWFDFHHACRGMKFENVSQLLTTLKGKIEELGNTIQLGANVTQKQAGVLRTNCMDCLDRTNVCQSSFAKHMLDLQLKQEGIDMTAQLDQVAPWFNTLWADNGDAVSKQYASTAAMKGDYTRTRKRDYRGALNDLGLSLARFYSGHVHPHHIPCLDE